MMQIPPQWFQEVSYRREREGRGREREETVSERKTDREQRQNSELYYTKIKILFTCLFLQSAPANPHTSRLHIKQ